MQPGAQHLTRLFWNQMYYASLVHWLIKTDGIKQRSATAKFSKKDIDKV